MQANDKAVLMAYLHQTNLIINEGQTAPRLILERMKKGIEMWRKAEEGVTCLQCGFPWVEHQTTTPGGTDYFCIALALEAKA